MSILDTVTVVVRSSGERTESLCKKLILAQGFNEEQIKIVKESPFSKALLVGLEVALSLRRKWSLFVDADIFLRQGSIKRLLDVAETQAENVCEIQGYVLDKFFGGVRKGGIHLYRTSLIEKVITVISLEDSNLRPESYALNILKSRGYPWVTVKELVGLHDFEQYHQDIFRKCFVHANKHIELSDVFIPFWRSMSSKDSDYNSALEGFSAGIRNQKNVEINARAVNLKPSHWGLSIPEKSAISEYSWSFARIEKTIREWSEPESFRRKYPVGIMNIDQGIISSIYRQHKLFRKNASIADSLFLTLGRCFEEFGRLLQSRYNKNI